MSETNSLRYPVEFQLLGKSRVMSKYRLWPARLFLIFVLFNSFLTSAEVAAESTSTAGALGSVVGALLGAFFVLALLYWALSRPMTDSELDSLEEESVSNMRSIECPDCSTETDAAKTACPECGTVLR
jgi:preprotein translocase subunit SecG